jgi:UDP-N-acetylmuramyl pentapeptide synthase
MKVLIIDMTHGGTVLASEFSKKQNCEVFAWDIYHTLTEEDRSLLEIQGIELVDESFYNEQCRGKKITPAMDKSEILVVAPVHCKLPSPSHMTHHQAVGYLLKDEINVPVIEITGVKGKTSTAAMLKEIYRDKNPLILSSLGVVVVKDGEEITLQKDISITPASLVTAWRLAQKFYDDKIPGVGVCIFESSLGGTGMADVGIITNIAEDYSIAKGSSSASKAKLQMFESRIVVCDGDSFHEIYSPKSSASHQSSLSSQISPLQSYQFSFPSDQSSQSQLSHNLSPSPHSSVKIATTFSIEDGKIYANVKAHNIHYDLYKTSFQVEITDLVMVNGELLNTSFKVATFAPAKHHLENTLSAITASLSMGTPISSIIKGLENFKGLPGRTSLLKMGEMTIIEEINPGINVTAVRKAVNMIKDYEKPALILGGSYGVTCEEIDEKSLSNFLDDLDHDILLVLTGDLGRSLWEKMGKLPVYQDKIEMAINHVKEAGSENVLFIYRSNFRELSRR